ncbi:MAG TPA: histidinol dehydrogenase, partial [Actinomycetota bacterium]|nr:histidinol dehydrogenase [Actinomycetota bacterium]
MLELIDGRGQSTPVHIPRPRPVGADGDPADIVRGIIDEVRLKGDAALVELTARFDGPRLSPGDLLVGQDKIDKARSLVRPELIDALEVMVARLRRTCEQQMPREWFDRSTRDEVIGELVRPLRRVGVY